MNDPTPPRFYVSYFDTFDAWRDGNPEDGWGIWGFWPERLFDSLDAARACRDQLNAKLGEYNPDAVNLGEHYGIIDREGGEIECVRQRRVAESD